MYQPSSMLRENYKSVRKKQFLRPQKFLQVQKNPENYFYVLAISIIKEWSTLS